LSKPRIALQAFTVRDDLSRDFAGTLAAIARIGYPAVQMAWFSAATPPTPEIKRVLDDVGLTVAGCHVMLEELERRLELEVERCLALDTRDVIIPWLAPERRSGYRRLADGINALGARCKEMGARLHYHNHDFEYEAEDGQTAIDILLGNSDPTLVKFEPDVYWIKAAGADPADEIRRWAGRCPIIHLKDMTNSPNPTFAEVGEGVIDFRPIFDAAESQGAEWYVAEQDWTARPPLEAAALSLTHLREWGKL
jgi:sugar phosphate isomerase/epimerase